MADFDTDSGTDARLREIIDTGKIDAESAQEWLAQAFDCLEVENLDGASVGNAINQLWKAMIALKGIQGAYTDDDGTFDIVHTPQRGDDVAAWIKRARDHYPQGTGYNTREYQALDALLDDYRLHADTGTRLTEDVDEP